MRLSFQPTGTHPSQRSAWEWKSDTRKSSLYSSSKPTPSTHWFLMVFTDLPHWVATRGSRWLVLKLRYSLTVTRRDSTPNGATAIPDTPSEQPELVSLVTNKTTALPVTPESDLVLEDTPMTPTRVETKLYTGQITETSTSKQWDTFLFSKITRSSICVLRKRVLLLSVKRCIITLCLRSVYNKHAFEQCGISWLICLIFSIKPRLVSHSWDKYWADVFADLWRLTNLLR